PEPGEPPGVAPVAGPEEAPAGPAVGLTAGDEVHEDGGEPRAPGDGVEHEREERSVEEAVAGAGGPDELRIDLVPEARRVTPRGLDRLASDRLRRPLPGPEREVDSLAGERVHEAGGVSEEHPARPRGPHRLL